MHEKNDVVEIDDDEEEVEAASLSSTQKEMRKKKHLQEEEKLNSENVETVADEEEYEYSQNGDEVMEEQEGLQEEAGDGEDPTSKQSGDTPTSVGVRFPEQDVEMSSADHDESGQEADTANKHASSGAGTGA